MERSMSSPGDGGAKRPELPDGLIVPILTPLTPSGAIDESASELLIEYLLREQVNGLFVLGSSGEGDSLPTELQYDFAGLVASRVAGRIPLFLGAMQAGTLRQTDFVRRCPSVGHYAAVVAPVPYYRRLRCEAEVIEHYRRLRDDTGQAIVAYGTPHPSAGILTVPVLMRLATSGLLCALKDSSGRIEPFRELIQRGFNRDGLRLYQGEPSLCLDSLKAGANGLIAGTANFIPWVFVELCQAVRTGDDARAAQCHEQILAFRKFARITTPYSAHGFHYSTFKAGLDVMEFGGGTPAAPYQRLPESLLARLQVYFAAAGVREHAVHALLSCELSRRARHWAQLRETVRAGEPAAAPQRSTDEPAAPRADTNGVTAHRA